MSLKEKWDVISSIAGDGNKEREPPVVDGGSLTHPIVSKCDSYVECLQVCKFSIDIIELVKYSLRFSSKPRGLIALCT
jgi:hypothetical protein